MRILNRQARHDYQLLDRFEAGISLTGPEVKSVKKGAASLKGSYARVLDDQIYLINAHINPYPFARQENYQPTRSRKLLLHKKEIISLKTKTESQNLTIVPLSLYTKGNIIKVELALARGKKKADRRAALRKREIEREIEREVKGI